MLSLAVLGLASVQNNRLVFVDGGRCETLAKANVDVEPNASATFKANIYLFLQIPLCVVS